MSQFTEHGNSLSFTGLESVQLTMQCIYKIAMLLTALFQAV